MKLHEELGRIFGEELEKIIIREQDEEDFLPQEDFVSCEARARAGVKIASERAVKILTLAIVSHRENEHGEKRSQEAAEASTGLTSSDVEVGTMSWWNT